MLGRPGRKKHTALDKLQTSSTFSLLKDIYHVDLPEELAKKLSSAKAIRREKIIQATSFWLSGEHCLGEKEIKRVAKKTACFTGHQNCESRIVNYYYKGPEQLFLALSGQQVSYYMRGPENEFQKFVLIISQLKRFPTESLSFQTALSQLFDSLEYVEENPCHLSLGWLYKAISELLESKAFINEPIPPKIDELFRREVNQVFKGERPDRLFIHLPSDDLA